MSSRGLAFFSVFAGLVHAQSIVSTHSGVVHFFEGTVSIDGQKLEPKFGRFDEIKPGSELRTERGRAEVLLTPGVLLRVDENTSVRMVSNKLADTRLDLVSGAAALDSRNAAPGAPVLIGYKDYQMRFAHSGHYRFDSAPAALKVDEGEADVLLKDKTVVVKAGQMLALSTPLTARTAAIRDQDGLDRWDDDRSGRISADNKSAAASDDLSSALDDPQNNSYGSGGSYGGYAGLTPDPMSSGYYAGLGVTPFWLAAPGYGLGYVPLYLPVPGYRLSQIRNGIYHFPSRSYLPARTGTGSLAPARVVPRPMPHPVIHR